MAVLVTGGAGYIGSHMVWRLLDAGEEVVVIDRLCTGHRWAVPQAASFVEADIADVQAVEKAIAEHRVEAIIHFAGSILVPESVADPLTYYENNTVKSRALIQTAVRMGVKNFVFSSTAAVYAPGGNRPVAEDAACVPQSPYGTSKLMTEYMLRDTARAHDFRYAALRYFNVAGADPQMRSGQSSKVATHLVKIVAEAFTGKRAGVHIYGTDYDTPDGTCVRDYIHVWDLVDAHYAALDHLRHKQNSIVANCGYGRGFSVKEVIDQAQQAMGQNLDVSTAERRPGDPPAIVANSDFLRAKLNWTPQFDSLDQIVRHAVAWEKQLRAKDL